MASKRVSKLVIGLLGITGVGALGYAYQIKNDPQYAQVHEAHRLERKLARLEAGLSQGVSYETIYNNKCELSSEAKLEIKAWGDETIETREKLACIQANPTYQAEERNERLLSITGLLYAGIALPTALVLGIAHSRK